MMARGNRSFVRASVFAALSFLVASPASAFVTKASDVCATNADPCQVTTVLDIPDGLCTQDPTITCTTNTDCAPPGFCKLGAVTLDFGVRDVLVTGAGQFNFGTASGSILCGDFTASTTSPAIDAAGVDSGGTDSGTVKIFSRRKCSIGGGTAPACLTNNDCQAGTCSKRRCSLNAAKTCNSDAECNVGPCLSGIAKKCQNDANVQCLTNADCNLGTCPAQLTCSNRPVDPRNCATNTDCNFGTCSVGTASISMGGSIVGNSEFPAFIDLRAADNITLTKTTNLNGTTADSDGGELSLDATFGDITVGANITATSGGFSTGGDVSLYAGRDVLVNAEIDITGGDYDGGTIDFDAGRDLVITRSIFGNSGSGAGYGGEFLAVAGRDFTVSGVSSASKTTLETSGHANLFNEAGDGGAQDYSAERDMTLNVNTRMISNGASPDAIGGDVALDTSDDLVFNGDVTAKALGANGGGGTLEGFSTNKTTVGASGTVDVTGGADGGGEVSFFSGTDLSFAGLADLGASNGGSGGSATLHSDTNATVSGTVRISSGDHGDIDVRGCYITLTGTGKLDAGLTDSDNTLRADELIKLNSGSLMKAGPLGSNTLVYRTASKLPQNSGTVSPTATLVLDNTLKGCVICGNGLLDGGESCEDGNTANGDGCNSQCQNEACVAQTAPKVACTTNADCGPRKCVNQFCSPWDLCEDGNVCTTDTCNNPQNTCVHTPRNCADAFACTTDSCNAQTNQCDHVPNDAACADNNDCSDEVCNPATGCVITPNTDTCSDNVDCTTGDTCSNFSCIGIPGEGCGFCGDGQKTGNELCDDGNATYSSGEYCGLNCATLVPCGKATAQTGTPKSSDAQYALRAAVGQVTCSLRVCDVDNSTKIVASDAQRILRKAVGQDVTLNCPTSGN